MKFYIAVKPSDEARTLSKTVHKLLSAASHQCTEVPKESDIIVSVGGDGTLFHTITNHIHEGKPFIGVNGGALGYRCAVGKSNLEEVEARLSEMPFSLSVLDVEWGGTEDLAVQDVRVERLDHRALRLQLVMNGEVISQVHLGDGVLVANALGSTGYNTSAGGYEIPLSADAAVVTPVSPFPNKLYDSLTISIPLVGSLEVTPSTRARLVLDDRAYEIEAGTRVRITQRKGAYQLIAREES
jgi:NAD+ kinase